MVTIRNLYISGILLQEYHLFFPGALYASGALLENYLRRAEGLFAKGFFTKGLFERVEDFFDSGSRCLGV